MRMVLCTVNGGNVNFIRIFTFCVAAARRRRRRKYTRVQFPGLLRA